MELHAHSFPRLSTIVFCHSAGHSHYPISLYLENAHTGAATPIEVHRHPDSFLLASIHHIYCPSTKCIHAIGLVALFVTDIFHRRISEGPLVRGHVQKGAVNSTFNPKSSSLWKEDVSSVRHFKYKAFTFSLANRCGVFQTPARVKFVGADACRSPVENEYPISRIEARAFLTDPGCGDRGDRRSFIDEETRTSETDSSFETVEVDDCKSLIEADACLTVTDPSLGDPVEFEDLKSSILASAVYWRFGGSSSSDSEEVSQTGSFSIRFILNCSVLFGGTGGGRSGCVIPNGDLIITMCLYPGRPSLYLPRSILISVTF